jgi:hypothetical protein
MWRNFGHWRAEFILGVFVTCQSSVKNLADHFSRHGKGPKRGGQNNDASPEATLSIALFSQRFCPTKQRKGRVVNWYRETFIENRLCKAGNDNQHVSHSLGEEYIIFCISRFEIAGLSRLR